MIKPVDDKVLIKIDKARAISKGGIIDPAMGRRKMPIGKVLAIGENVKRTDILGNRVNFDLYEGWRYDDDHLLIKEEHIYLLLLPDKNDKEEREVI